MLEAGWLVGGRSQLICYFMPLVSEGGHWFKGFIKGHWTVAGASWPCEKLDWGAMETELSNQLLYSTKIFVMNRVCKSWRMTILKLFN